MLEATQTLQSLMRMSTFTQEGWSSIWIASQVLVVLLFASILLLLFTGSRRKRRSHSSSSNDAKTSCRQLLTKEMIDPIVSRKWKEVSAWILFHPDELLLRDKNNQTVLHHACLFRAPAAILQMILWAAPELASVKNEDRLEVPLHWAIRLSAPNECLKSLMDADPQAGVLARDKDGHTPLSLIWDRYRTTFLQTWWDEGRETLVGLSSWKRTMLFFRPSTRNLDQDAVNWTLTSTLHVACQTPCPPAFFPLLAQVFQDEIRQPDCHGRLPLHVACTDPIANRSEDALTKIQILLKESVEAAGVADQSGRIPFYTALSSGIGWDEGLKALFDLNPKLIATRDPITGLYPFMLAATGARNRQYAKRLQPQEGIDKGGTTRRSLDTIFTLLRLDPSRVKPCD